MSLIVTKQNGGLGRRTPNNDAICGLLVSGVAVAGGVQLNTIYTLKSVSDATTLLITAAYDTANSILVFEHINEFFRVNPNGELRLMVVAQSVTLSDMVLSTTANAKTLLQSSQGSVKVLAVAYNPATQVSALAVSDAVIANAQALADEEYNQNRPVSIVIEGAGFDHASPVDFRAKNAKNVSVFVGQSLSVAKREISSATPYSKYAAIGTCLGAISKAAVNENIGWPQKFNLYGGTILSPGINNVAVSTISQTILDDLNTKGTIFFKLHTGIAGVYINDGHTATAITSDFAYLANNRVIDKAVRAIRAKLLPRLNSPVQVDSVTGNLSQEVVKSYETDGRSALEDLLNNNEISSLDVYVDPAQNILSSSQIEVRFSVVPTGTARTISVTIGFVNPFN